MSPAWTWREPVIEASGRRAVGYRFRLPISVGVSEFNSLDQIDELSLDSVGAVSVVPGVEIEIPMSERWRLKPMGYLGLGTETDGGGRAEIFRFGLRSQYAFQFDDTSMRLVNGLERIGYSADESSDAINLFQSGLDFSRPLAETKLGGVPVVIHWHVMYTRYLDSLDLGVTLSSPRSVSVGSEWELGAAFGKQTGRLKFWRFSFERLGISYRVGADGDFSGLGIVFRSLFDR